MASFQTPLAYSWVLALLAVIPAARLLRLRRERRGVGEVMGRRPTADDRRAAGLSLVALAAIAGAFLLLLTPTGARFARAASLATIIVLVIAVTLLAIALRGLVYGRATPLISGQFGPYIRKRAPKRYWSSTALNTGFAVMMAWLTIGAYATDRNDADWQTCLTPGNAHVGIEAACSRAIDAEQQSLYDLGLLRLARANNRSVMGQRTAAELDSAIALDLFSEQLRQTPDDYESRFQRGVLLLNAGRIEESIADFDAVVKVRTGDRWAHANRGIAYAWLKDTVQAEKDFAIVTAVDPANPVMLRGRALLAVQGGDPAGARILLGQALQRDPDDIWSRELLGQLSR